MFFGKRKSNVQVPERVPEHVAVIMDGNGRWAKKRGLPRTAGHRAGMETLHKIVRASKEAGIKVLSVYAFSTENWSRSAEEVSVLMGLLVEYLFKEIDELISENVVIRVMGRKDRCPKECLEAMQSAQERTKNNTGMVLNIGFDYGGRYEIAEAVKEISAGVANRTVDLEDIDEEFIKEHLYTRGLPDVDLVIRTSGEKRLSNFMLYQASYAEFVFPDTPWPDYSVEEFYNTLREFAGRDRRFGGVKQ